MDVHDDVSFVSAGGSPLRTVLDEARRAARGGAHVLVAGEPGTGKEALARALHAWSGRAGPFVALWAQSGGRDDILRRAFGAGTAAAGAPGGLLAAARGGTLYVEEVADLPGVVQAALASHLLRARAAGRGDTPRVVAATTADLARALAEGRLLRSLHDAFACGITIPSLRDRPRDVVAILERLWSVRGGGRALEARALLRVVEHRWPGNVAELDAFVSRLALLAEGNPISPAEVAKQLRAGALDRPRSHRARERGGAPRAVHPSAP